MPLHAAPVVLPHWEGLCGARRDAALTELLQESPFTGKASSWADIAS